VRDLDAVEFRQEREPTEEAQKRALAAKNFIENMYKTQIQHHVERRERRGQLQSDLLHEGYTNEEMTEILDDHDKKESEFMRLQVSMLGHTGHILHGEAEWGAKRAYRGLDVFSLNWEIILPLIFFAAHQAQPL